MAEDKICNKCRYVTNNLVSINDEICFVQLCSNEPYVKHAFQQLIEKDQDYEPPENWQNYEIKTNDVMNKCLYFKEKV